jgi:carbonic anhydrase
MSCACCHPLTSRVGRRGLLFGAAALSLAPRFVLAAEGKYEAMILGCIDPRLQSPVRDYAVKHELDGKYSQFTIAGAAIAVVAPAFEKWRRAFWDNLATTIKLHDIARVIAIDHRDCGAARIAYGDDSISTPQKEDATHKAVFDKFRKEVGERHPKLKVEALLMALDGSFISFS